MDLTKIRETKHDSAKFMEEEITKVIKTFGKRDPGSQGETDAINYMAEQLKEYSDDVKVEPFDVYPGSFMGWIYFSVTLVLIGIGLYFVMPILTIVLELIAMGLMLGQFLLYRQMIDKLFKKKTSYNVTAVKKPTGEVKRRIFFNGHPDSAYEWTLNYHVGGWAFIGHFLLTMLAVIYVAVISVISMIINGVGIEVNEGLTRILGYVALGTVPVFVGMYFLWNEKQVVDGANDNLTGCYMGIAIMKALKEQGVELENTEVGVIISGSEEAGLRGAKAWAKAHKDDYKDVETVIFAYDTIHEGKFLGANYKDLNGFVPADKMATDMFIDAAKELNIKCSRTTVPLGATDSAAFNQGGFRAVGITAMDHNLQDYYHTRRDTYDNLDLKGLADCFEVSVKVLENFENK